MPFPWLLWARYSAFLPLYPLGVASELTMVWLALSTLKRERPWSIEMPNAFNFGFDYFWTCMLIVIAYVPGLYLPSSPSLTRFINASRVRELNFPALLQACRTCTSTCSDSEERCSASHRRKIESACGECQCLMYAVLGLVRDQRSD